MEMYQHVNLEGKTMDYLLTIAIPTYNGANTITQMLEILLPQIDNRVQVIVSDNASTDNTSDIIKEYQKQYPIKYIRNEKNIGPDANFLQCMRKAEGEFTYLLSDDDVLVEGALTRILDYLEKHRDVAFVYLDSVGFSERYEGIEHCHCYPECVMPVEENICTTDRKKFMSYAMRMWGFMASYLWKTSKFWEIENPEQYYGTYWLQSYIHAGCMKNWSDKLGVIKGPCLAAGEYGGVNNFCCGLVDGVYYKKMLNYTIEVGGCDRNQLERFYQWRICMLGRNAVIHERECGIHKTSIRRLFFCVYKYPYAWIHLIPFFFVPKWMILRRREKQKREIVYKVKRDDSK